MEQLAENKYGVSKPKNRLHHLKNRLFRKKAFDFAKADTPFSWQVGVTGRTIYPVKNQFESDSCFGQMFSMGMRTILGGAELSAKSAYSVSYSQGGGVGMPEATTTAITKGLTTEANVPSTQNNGGDCQEPFIESTAWQTPVLIQDCLTRAGYEFLTVNIDIDSIAQAVNAYQAVGMIITGQNGNTPSWLSATPSPPQSTNPNPTWEHFLLFCPNVEPQTSTKILQVYNSWGTEVGMNGIQNFDASYLNPKYVVDVFAIVPFTFQNDLFLGCFGDSVTRLQQILQKLGYFKTQPSGFFGTITLSAVEAWQKANNITPMLGYFGSISRGVMNSYLSSQKQVI